MLSLSNVLLSGTLVYVDSLLHIPTLAISGKSVMQEAVDAL